jgi:hypothetical protein
MLGFVSHMGIKVDPFQIKARNQTGKHMFTCVWLAVTPEICAGAVTHAGCLSEVLQTFITAQTAIKQIS